MDAEACYDTIIVGAGLSGVVAARRPRRPRQAAHPIAYVEQD